MKLEIKGNEALEQALKRFYEAEQEFKEAAYELSRLGAEVTLNVKDLWK